MKDRNPIFLISPTLGDKIYFILILAVTLSIPFKAIYNSIFCILLIVFWLFFLRKSSIAENFKIVLSISSIFWLALIGMMYTQNLEEGFFRLQQKFLLLLLPLVIGTTNFNWTQKLKSVLSVYIVSVFVACSFCLMEAFIFWIQDGCTDHFFSQSLVRSAFVDLYPYILSALCLSAILILAESLLGKVAIHPKIQSTKTAVTLMLFLSVFILLLGVKQLIIAWIFFGIIYSFKLKQKLSLIIIGALVIITTLSILIFKPLQNRVLEVTEEAGKANLLQDKPELGLPVNGMALRRAIWICAGDAIFENPLLGVGTGDGQDILQQSYQKRNFALAYKYNRFNAHNQYLQTTVAFGFAGLVIWFGSLVWLAWRFRRSFLFISLILVMVIAMITESLLETNKGVLVMSFLLTVGSFGIGLNEKTSVKKNGE